MSFPTILTLGDSLTEQSFSPHLSGSSIHLQHAYTRRASLLNCGLSGYTSTWLLPFFTRVITSHLTGALLWIVMLGTNDCVLPGYVHHVPLETFRENLEGVIGTIMAQAEGMVLVVTPPPIDMGMLKDRGPRGGRDRSTEANERYAGVAREVGRKWERRDARVAVCDFWTMMESLAVDVEEGKGGYRFAEYMTDGLHLSAGGYKVLFEGIMGVVEERWPEITPARLPLLVGLISHDPG